MAHQFVMCHVLAPSEWSDFSGTVYIEYWFINGQSAKIASELVGKFDDGYYEYQTLIPVPIENKLLFYCYHITSEDADCTEYFRSNFSNHRKLHLKDVLVQRRGYIHQYDGVIVNNYVTQEKQGELVERALIAHLDNQVCELRIGDASSEEFLLQVQEIIRCLKNVHDMNTSEWQNIVKKVLKTLFTWVIENNKETSDKRSRQGISIASVHLVTKYSVNLERESAELLFRQMMIVPSSKEEVCHQVKRVKEHFPTTLREMVKSLQKFALKSQKIDAYWLFCVPLIHFLTDKCEPYEKPSVSAVRSKKPDEWWGIVKLEDERNRTYDISVWKRNVSPENIFDVIRTLSPIFEVDYLLPRFIMKLLQPDQLEKAIDSKIFPDDVCLDRLYHKLLLKNTYYNEPKKEVFKVVTNFPPSKTYICISTKHVIERNSLIIKQFQRCLFRFFDLIRANGFTQSESFDEITCVMWTFEASFKFLMDGTFSYRMYPILVGSIASLCTQTLALLVEKVNEGKERNASAQTQNSADELEKTVQKYREKFISWLKDISHVHGNFEFLKFWDFHLAIKMPGAFSVIGIPTELKRELDLTVQKHALKPSSAYQKAYGEVLSNALDWEKVTLDILFNIAVEWYPFQHYLSVFDGEHSEYLSRECSRRLAEAALVLRTKLTDFMDRSLSHKDVFLISANFEHFIQSINIMEKREMREQLQSQLCQYNDVLEKLVVVRKNVNLLLDLCCRINVVVDIGHIVPDHVKQDVINLRSLCAPEILSSIHQRGQYSSKTILFNVGDDALQTMTALMQYHDSKLFLKYWDQNGKKVEKENNGKLTFEEVMKRICEPVLMTWRKYCVTVFEMRRTNHFKDFDEKELKKEIDILSANLKQNLYECLRGTSNKIDWIKVSKERVGEYENSEPVPIPKAETTQWNNPVIRNSTSSKATEGQRPGISGLSNIGSTCYANSIFQVLGQTPRLRTCLEMFKNKESERSATLLLYHLLEDVNANKFDFDKNLEKLMEKIFTADVSFKRYYQNDCHSFFISLLNMLEEEVGQCKTAPSHLFEGSITNLFSYSSCSHKDQAGYQKFFSLMIPLTPLSGKDRRNNYWSVKEGLQALTDKEEFEKNALPCKDCKSGNADTVTTKQLIITKSPRILVLQLPRFEECHHDDSTYLRKCLDEVWYDRTLDVKWTDNTKHKGRPTTRRYELYGVVQHYGTLNSGHYTCLVKQNQSAQTAQSGNASASSNVWYRCSDTCVREIDENAVLIEGANTACLLFYELLDPQDVS